jgi:hypothetical protein
VFQNGGIETKGHVLHEQNRTPGNGDEVPMDNDGVAIGVDDRIDAKVQVILPLLRNRETTMDAFKRLTNQAPWIPFNVGGKDEVDLEEATIFDQMHVQYNRRTTWSSRGYFSFMKAWNIEVANRYREHAEGNIGVILINRKSVSQLEEYYDKTEGKLSSSLRVEHGDNAANHSELQLLNGVLRESRRNMSPLPAVEHAQPTEYPQQGYAPVGCPTVLNASIVAGALYNRGDNHNSKAE